MNAEQHENHRVAVQAELDSKKSREERNRLGQFATPTILAREMIEYGVSLLPKRRKINFLDPAFGTGSFYSALIATTSSSQIASAQGIELDEHYGEPAKSLWKGKALRLSLADFTRLSPGKTKANLLICNPPYVRHHHLEGDEKQRLQSACVSASGMALSGLAGLYCYFLGLSHTWMEKEAIAGWLIPSEFMDVNYGEAVKRYLLDEVTLLRIHRFDPSDVQFDDALVSSAVVWFRNAAPPSHHQIEFTFGGTHQAPAKRRVISRTDLRSEPKWTRFPRQEPRGNAIGAVLSDLFAIKRGIATGSNEFFILSPERAAELKLPREFLRPILPSPRYLPEDEVLADDEGNPTIDKPLWLIDCRLPEEEVRLKFPRLWEYLEQRRGEMITRYLCKTRSPWYSQEHRDPSPFVCTYMGRGSSRSSSPFRFILNHSRAIVANSYLVLYPKPVIQQRLRDDPKLIRLVWHALCDIDHMTLIGEGRVYGGGLHKMEPKELANVSAKKLFEILRVPFQQGLFAA